MGGLLICGALRVKWQSMVTPFSLPWPSSLVHPCVARSLVRPRQAHCWHPCGVLQVWLGGDKNQTRLAQQYQDKVKVRDLDSFLDSLFFAYAEGRSSTSEAFGDWVNRLGLQGVKAAQQAQQQKAKAAEPVPA